MERCKSCAVIRSKPIPNAVAKLGGPFDIIIIEAMHSHDDVSEDLRGALPPEQSVKELRELAAEKMITW